GTLLMNATPGADADVQIGNGGFFGANLVTQSGDIVDSGAVSVTVLGGADHSGQLTLTGDNDGAFVEIGNGSVDQQTGTATGDITLNVDGTLSIAPEAGRVFVGNIISNIIGSNGTQSGDVFVTARDVSGLTASMLNDLAFGNF